MTRTFLSLFLFLAVHHAISQQTAFQMDIITGGQDNAIAVTENSSGNFLIASESWGTGNDIALVEISSTGTVIRSQSVVLPEHEFIKSVFETSDGHYIVTGNVQVANNNMDWIILKFDSALNLVWYKTYGTAAPGNDYANNGFEISTGHYAITGTVALGGSAKPSLVTLDSSGAVIMEGYLTTNQFASPRYKGFYLGDGKIAFAHLANAISILDTSGAVINHYGSSFGTYSTDITKTNNGGYAITSLGNYGAPTGSKMVLSVLDSTLSNIIFNIEFGSNGNNFIPVAVRQDMNGDFWLAGNVESLGSGTYTPIVAKFDPNGTLIWCNSYTPTGGVNPQINTMIQTSDGGFLIAGQMSTALQRMYVVKIDSTGGSSCGSAPFVITPQAAVSVTRNPHQPYTGTIGSFGASIPVITNPNATANIHCITVGLNDQYNISDIFSVHPSLFNDGFYVQSTEPLSYAYLRVVDAAGKTVLHREIGDDEFIECSQLPNGIYFVNIQAAGHEVIFRKKMVKSDSE